MRTTRRHARRIKVGGLLAGLALIVSAGCAQKYAAEQDGKDAGEALCDLRGASEGEVDDAVVNLELQLDELDENYAVFTAEDRADIRENLSDLAEHIQGGDELLAQQDLAVIQRSIDNIRGDVSDTSEAALDGFLEGIDDCVNG